MVSFPESFNWAGQQQFTPFDSWEYAAQTGNGRRAPEGKSWPWDPGMQFPDWCSALSHCHRLQPWPSLSHGLLTRGNEGGGDQLLQGVDPAPSGVSTQILQGYRPAPLGVDPVPLEYSPSFLGGVDTSVLGSTPCADLSLQRAMPLPWLLH